MQFSGEGVDNVIMTDHHAHKDLNPRIAALGSARFLTSTIGEEITTFDYGHFNGYPFTADSEPALARLDGLGHRGARRHGFPVARRLLGDPGADPRDRAREPDGDARHHRADQPHRKPLRAAQDRHLAGAAGGWLERGRSTRLPPDAGEPGISSTTSRRTSCWNGSSRGHQSEFLDQRIGIWFNLPEPGPAHDRDLRHRHAHVHRPRHRGRAHLDGVADGRRAGRDRAGERRAGRRRREGGRRAGHLRADAARLRRRIPRRWRISAWDGSTQRLGSGRRARSRDPRAGADLGGVRPDPDLRQRGDGARTRSRPASGSPYAVQRRFRRRR